MWKTLSSKEIFKHPRIVLIEDEVVLPNNKKTTYLKFKQLGNQATLICKNDSGKILLQKEYSHPSESELYQFPGGGISLDEDIETGANRELMEEEKIRAKTLTPLGFYYPNDRRSTTKNYVFLATDLEKADLPGDIEEIIESTWLTEKEIDEMIARNKIMNASTLSAWSLYKARSIVANW